MSLHPPSCLSEGSCLCLSDGDTGAWQQSHTESLSMQTEQFQIGLVIVAAFCFSFFNYRMFELRYYSSVLLFLTQFLDDVIVNQQFTSSDIAWGSLLCSCKSFYTTFVTYAVLNNTYSIDVWNQWSVSSCSHMAFLDNACDSIRRVSEASQKQLSPLSPLQWRICFYYWWK